VAYNLLDDIDVHAEVGQPSDARAAGVEIDGKIPLGVNETQSGDLNDMKNGFYYSAQPNNLMNAPEGITEGPAFCMFVGIKSFFRGVQVLFSFPYNGKCAIYMRGLLNIGWSTWKSIKLT